MVSFSGDTIQGVDSNISVSSTGTSGNMNWSSVDDSNRLYIYPIYPNDVLSVTVSGNTYQDVNLSVIRRDYTTINEDDNGIKDTVIYTTGTTPSVSYTLTATTLDSSYDFEYRIESSVENVCYDIGSGYGGFLSPRVNDVEYKNGLIYTRGRFATYSGISQSGITVTLPNGSLSPSFTNYGTDLGTSYQALKVYDDGKILVAAQTYNNISVNGIVRLNSNGTIDSSFSGFTNGSNGAIYDLEIQNDGKILVGGFFTQINSTTKQGIARLNTNGSLDSSYAGTGFSGGYAWVYDIDLQNDGKAVCVGNFWSFSGVSCPHICRLNTDGTKDNSFNSPFDTGNLNYVSVVVLSDGKILIASSGLEYNGNYYILMRLNSDGSVDNTFNSILAGSTYPTGIIDIAVYSNNKILINTYLEILRLNEDGNIDNTFNNLVFDQNRVTTQESIAIDETSNRIYFGGGFTTVNGIPYNNFVVTDLDGNLKMC